MHGNDTKTHARLQELSIGQIRFKAFDLGGHEIARKVWKDYYAKVRNGFATSLPPFRGVLEAPKRVESIY